MPIERSRPALASATAIVTATALSALCVLSADVVLGLPADRIGAVAVARSDGFGRAQAAAAQDPTAPTTPTTPTAPTTPTTPTAPTTPTTPTAPTSPTAPTTPTTPTSPPDTPTAESTPISSPGPLPIYLPIVWRAGRLGELPAPSTAPPPTPTDSATTQPATPTLSPTPTVSPTPLPLPTTPLPEGCTDPLINGDFEARGAVGWIEQTEPGGSIIVAEAARSGRFGARIGAWDGGEEVLLSEEAIPTEDAGDRVITLRWWMRVTTDEPIDGHVGDRMLVALVGDVPEAVELVRTYDEEDWLPEGVEVGADGWAEMTLDLSLDFVKSEDFSTASIAFISVPDFDDALTTFDLDDVRLEICPPGVDLDSRLGNPAQ